MDLTFKFSIVVYDRGEQIEVAPLFGAKTEEEAEEVAQQHLENEYRLRDVTYIIIAKDEDPPPPRDWGEPETPDEDVNTEKEANEE